MLELDLFLCLVQNLGRILLILDAKTAEKQVLHDLFQHEAQLVDFLF